MDRDGCLTEEVGYVNHPTRIRLLPRTADYFDFSFLRKARDQLKATGWRP